MSTINLYGQGPDAERREQIAIRLLQGVLTNRVLTGNLFFHEGGMVEEAVKNALIITDELITQLDKKI